MKAKVISVCPVNTQNGSTLYKTFCVLSDGNVGHFYTPHQFKPNDEIQFILSVAKDGKFSVRPVLPR